MKAIILSAGRGTRFENSGKTNHKSLLKISGSTIIERQLKILKELGGLWKVSDWWPHLRKHLGRNATNYFMYQWVSPDSPYPPAFL